MSALDRKRFLAHLRIGELEDHLPLPRAGRLAVHLGAVHPEHLPGLDLGVLGSEVVDELLVGRHRGSL
jgi:hypothetical protein